MVSLWAIIITEERIYIITVRSCCRTYLTQFISEVRRSVRTCLLQVAASWKENQLISAWLTDKTVSKQKVILEKFGGKSTF